MTVTIVAVPGIPEVREGDDLALLIGDALASSGLRLADGDVLVVSSKVASKAMGLTAAPTDPDAVVAAESEAVVAERLAGARLTRVVRARAGPVMAAAGVDASNTGGRDVLLLLPHDPDAVCRDLHARLSRRTGVRRLAVVLSDTAGRPWRVGQTDFALGAHGLLVCEDLRGGRDADGRPLRVTQRAVADEIAAAADLVKGKASALPVAVVRGLGDLVPGGGARPPGARSLLREGDEDWFRQGCWEAVRAALGVEPGSGLSARLGIASTAPEEPATRVARAVAVAVHDMPGVGVDVGEQNLVVTGDDDFTLGVATARLLAALRGERLTGTVHHRTAAAVTLRLEAQQG